MDEPSGTQPTDEPAPARTEQPATQPETPPVQQSGGFAPGSPSPAGPYTVAQTPGPPMPPGWGTPWPGHPTAPGAPVGNPYGAPPPPGAPPGAPPPPYGSGAGHYGGGWHWGPPPYSPGWQQPAPAPRSTTRAAVAAMVGVGVLIAAVLGGLVGHGISQNQSLAPLNPGGGSSTPSSTPSGAPANAAAIAASVDSCLVDINTQLTTQGVQGAGTGMVLSSTGEVLTNNHVVEGANKMSATDVGNGKVYTATVVGYDRTQDVAVIQLSGASDLSTCPVGNSSGVGSGLGVVAVGNANGAGGTPSYAAGSITATNQTITASDEVDGSSEQLSGLLETDAGIVAGDSGGPLVSSSSKIIGMDTAASSGFQFANSGTQGYAIPINTAAGIARQIESGSSSNNIHVGTTAFLGVGVRDAGGSSAGGSGSSSGAEIVQIVPGGPADQAGLVVGDVVTNVNGHNIDSAEALTEVMTTQKPGSSLSVQYTDTSGTQHTVTVQSGSGPPQ